MDQKQYLDRLMQSLSHFLKQETLRGVEDNGNYNLLYRFGDLNQETRLEGFNKQTQFAEQRQLYEIVQERIQTTLDQELTQTEAEMLFKEAQASINFAARNMQAHRYKEAISCARRAAEDTTLLMQYIPEMQDVMANTKYVAEDMIEKSRTLWQNPKTGHLKLQLEEAIQKEKYELATKIRDKIRRESE